MQSTAARRAVTDVAAALAAFLVAGLWLGTDLIAEAGLRCLALAAGAAVIGRAAASILHRSPRFSTPADRVTLLRAVLVACCATVTVGGLSAGPAAAGLVVLLGTPALLLDAVDGRVARMTGTASVEGSLLDTDTDGALVLVLACAVAETVGPWTLAIGLAYYVFLAAGKVRPYLREPLAPRTTRKVIGALQPSALLFALVPGVPPGLGALGLGLALLLLLSSFGRDVLELERLNSNRRSLRRRAATAAETDAGWRAGKAAGSAAGPAL